MKAVALTDVHLDERLYEALKRAAQRDGKSVQEYVEALLREKVPACAGDAAPAPTGTVEHYIGRWTAEEAEEFNRALAEQRRIDAEEWQ